MKKHIFTLALFVAGIILASGCQKEDFSKTSSPVFTATIADATRTALDANTAGKVNWVAGDEITINGVVYVATPDAANASTASFNKKNNADPDPVPVEGYYYATYCCSYDAVASEGVIPTSQVYSAVALGAPMYAESETTALTFHNICGLLELNLKGEAAVKTIAVSADNAGMTGSFVIYDAQTAIIQDAQKNPSTLNCGDGVSLSAIEATSFYVPVPAGSYTGLKIVINFTDGGRQVFGKSASEVAIAANGLYRISLNVESKKDVSAQLPTGPEFNIAVKKLVADNPAAVTSENSLDTKIQKFVFVTESSSTEGVEIQTAESANKIFISANSDKSVLTISTPAKVIYANENSSNMFAYFTGMSEIENFAVLSTEKVTNMSKMFYMNNEVNTSVVLNDIALKHLDLSHFNTAKVTTFASMFNTCWNLESIEGLDKFNTSSATNMQHMFCNCNSLKSLDLSSFNTENVTLMKYMFYHCWGLTNLDLTNFNTEKVTDFGYMFYYCKNIETLDVSSFSTPNATTVQHMFNSCYKLKKLNLSKFDGSKFTIITSGGQKIITGVSYMMNQLGALEELWLGPNFGSKPNVVYTHFLVYSKTQTAANNRTATCNTTGTLVVHCTQTIAEWCVTLGAFKWLNNGYENQKAVPVSFVDIETGNPLSVTF